MFQRTLIRLVLCAGLLCSGAAIPAGAESSAFAENHRYCLTGEVGIGGYDPVAYFPEGGGKPQKGLFKLSALYDGVTYRFASQEDLDLFNATPNRYLPQYGGWCSFGIAMNGRFEADPQNYVIRDGKLYLFYRDPTMSTREVWLKDPQANIQKADVNWLTLSQ